MRKELTVFVKTNSNEGDELSVSSTSINDIVVISLPNGMRVGVNINHLLDALFEVKSFKKLNQELNEKNKEPSPNNHQFGVLEWVE